MGANMQRQAVPLLHPNLLWLERALKEVAEDSRTVTVSDSEGIVALADGMRIVVSDDGLKERAITKRGIYCYNLRKFLRSNAGTCLIKNPLYAKETRSRSTSACG